MTANEKQIAKARKAYGVALAKRQRAGSRKEFNELDAVVLQKEEDYHFAVAPRKPRKKRASKDIRASRRRKK